MGSPAQADIVNELYNRRDTLPDDKRAVVEELHSRLSGGSNPIGIRPATAMESIKSRFQEFMHDPIGTLTSPIPGTENMQGQGDPISRFVLGGAVPGESLVGKAASNFAAASKGKGLARIPATARAIKQSFQDALESQSTLNEARAAGQRYDAMREQPTQPQQPAPVPAPVPKTASGRPLTADEIAFQQAGTHPGTAPEDYPQPAPEPPAPAGPPTYNPPGLESSAAGYDPTRARALAKQQLKYTPGSEVSGRAYGAPKTAPIPSDALVPTSEPVPAPPSALETSAAGYDPAKARTLNKQLLKSSPSSEAGGGRSYSMPKKAPGATSPATTGAATPEVPGTPDTPVPAPAPSKTAQNLADKIQEHTTAKDQAIISHLKDKGVTPDQFKSMSPEEQNGVLNELNSKTGKKYRFRFDRGTQGTDAVNRLLDTWGK